MLNKPLIKNVFQTDSLVDWTYSFHVYWSVPYDLDHHMKISSEGLAHLGEDYIIHHLASAMAADIKEQLVTELKEMYKHGKIKKVASGGMVNEKKKFELDELSAIVPDAIKAAVPGLKEFMSCPYLHNCPSRHGKVPYSLISIIMHLNDTHKWTREHIADWLETLDIDLSFKEVENEG